MNIDELKQRVEKNTAGCESLPSELSELEAKLQDPSVWADQKLATEIGQQVREIKDKIIEFISSWWSLRFCRLSFFAFFFFLVISIKSGNILKCHYFF